MQEVCSFETWVPTHKPTRRHIPGHINVDSHHSDNLISHSNIWVFNLSVSSYSEAIRMVTAGSHNPGWQVTCVTQFVTVRVGDSRNRPGVAQRVPGGLGSQISMTFGTLRWWGRQPHAPAAFTLRKYSWYSFSLQTESTPGPWYGRKEICHWKIQWHHRESIPGPSD